MNSDEAYRSIILIGETGGRNDKKRYIECFSNAETFRAVLRYAYDPYLMFGVKKIPWQGHGKDHFSDITWRLLEVLASGKLSGNAAKSAVALQMQSLTPNSAELFKRILMKDLRCGVTATTINEAIPGMIPVHRVMLAQEIDLNRIEYPCWTSPKLDGVRAGALRGQLISRGGKEFVGMNHIHRGLTPEAPLDGELLIPGMTFEKSSGLVRNKKTTPNMHYFVFDVALPDLPFEERLKLMVGYVANHVNPFVHLVGHGLCRDEDALFKQHNYHLFSGFEGTMVKQRGHLYQNKRSYDWMKLKPLKEVDLVVIGISEGTGKYIEMLGFVTCLYKGKEINIGGGFTDNERVHYWDHPDQILHHVIEIHYMEETAHGALRHPRFKRIKTID